MKKQNTSWFSIIIAILLVVVMTLLVLYILEYMIPYSKNVKWIENSSNAFYQSEGWIEDAFFKIKNRSSITDESSKNMWTNVIDYDYTTTSSWNIIPPAWEWNSEFDINFNRLSTWNPIQLEVWNNMVNWTNSDFIFQVPDINNTVTETLSWGTLPIINWQLSAQNDTLNATWSWIKASQITTSSFNMGNFQWQNLAWDDTNNEKIANFYSSHCGTWSWCILKLSIINTLELINPTWTQVPYLEYKIDFWSKTVPLRYSRIKAKGKSYGFQKSLEVRVPQQTTNVAFDFTVFQ